MVSNFAFVNDEGLSGLSQAEMPCSYSHFCNSYLGCSNGEPHKDCCLQHWHGIIGVPNTKPQMREFQSCNYFSDGPYLLEGLKNKQTGQKERLNSLKEHRRSHVRHKKPVMRNTTTGNTVEPQQYGHYQKMEESCTLSYTSTEHCYKDMNIMTLETCGQRSTRSTCDHTGSQGPAQGHSHTILVPVPLKMTFAQWDKWQSDLLGPSSDSDLDSDDEVIGLERFCIQVSVLSR